MIKRNDKTLIAITQETANEKAERKIVNAMAKHAHDAWWDELKKQGYTSRKAPCGEEFMVPFESMSERGKEFDRIIMRGILKALDEQGFRIVPKAKP